MSGEQRPQFVGEFRYREVVEIVGQPRRVSQSLAGKYGYIMGCSEFDSPETGEREYAVHVNDYQEGFAVPRACLRGTGRIGEPEEIVTRSRLGRRVAHRA